LSDAVVPISYSPDNGQHYYQLKVYKSPTSPNRLAQFRLAGPVHAGASADSPTVYCRHSHPATSVAGRWVVRELLAAGGAARTDV